MSTPRVPVPDPKPSALSLQALAALAWHGAWFILVVAAIAGATAFAVTRTQPPVYQASSALLVTHPGSRYAGTNVIAPPSVDATVYQSALMDGPVLADALTRIAGRPPTDPEIRAARRAMTIKVDQKDLSSVIGIDYRSHDATYAANMANAVAQALVSWDRNRVRETFARTIATLQQSIKELDAQIGASSGNAQRALVTLRDQRTHDLQSVQSMNASSVTVALLEPLSAATVPTAPVGPRLMFKTAIATLLGLLGGFALLVLRFTVDRNVRGRADMVDLAGVPVLAEFARIPRKAHRLSGEVASVLRTNLMFAAHYESPLVVAITSAQSPNEKSNVAVSLAESFARAGRKTLLVDADLRRPGTASGLDVGSLKATPLETYLSDPAESYVPAAVAIGGKRTFDFIPSFTAAAFPVELLSNAFPSLLAGWRARYDCIIVDAPPVLPSADTLAIAPYCTDVAVCASLGTSLRDNVKECMVMLRQSDINVVGTVLTNSVRPRRSGRSDQYERYSVLDLQSVDPYRTFTRDPLDTQGAPARPSH